MSTKSAFSIVGLAHKICLAAEGQGYTPELLNTLAEHPTLFGELRNVQLGLSEIKPILHAIDCDADPYVPGEWRVEKHQKGGIFAWDPRKVKLFLSKKQSGGRLIEGNKLRKELAKKPVLNANVLDYLLKPENQHLIPEEWKGNYIFFWGTIYRGSNGSSYVRYLYWFGDRWQWRWNSDELGRGWHDRHPAALRAS